MTERKMVDASKLSNEARLAQYETILFQIANSPVARVRITFQSGEDFEFDPGEPQRDDALIQHMLIEMRLTLEEFKAEVKEQMRGADGNAS